MVFLQYNYFFEVNILLAQHIYKQLKDNKKIIDLDD